MFLNDKLYIDIRSNKFKYAQISFAGKNSTIKIKRFGTVYLSDEMVKSGNPWGANNLPELLSSFLRKEKITAKRLFMNISDPSVVIRTVEIPYMSVKNLSEYLKMEIAQYMPIDVTSNIFDFKILDTFTSDDKKFMSVLISAAPRQLIENCVSAFRAAGLSLEAVDIYPNTISRIFSKSSKNVAIADLNENFVDFTIIKSGRIFMYSNTEIMERNYMEENIYENMEVNTEDNMGESIERSINENIEKIMGENIEENIEESIEKITEEKVNESESKSKSKSENESENSDVKEASNIGLTGLPYDIDRLVGYIRTYLNFFSSRHFGNNVDVLYLFGDYEIINRLAGVLSETLGIRIVPGIPEGFEIKAKEKINDKAVSEACNKYLSVYMSNIGMALREVHA